MWRSFWNQYQHDAKSAKPGRSEFRFGVYDVQLRLASLCLLGALGFPGQSINPCSSMLRSEHVKCLAPCLVQTEHPGAQWLLQPLLHQEATVSSKFYLYLLHIFLVGRNSALDARKRILEIRKPVHLCEHQRRDLPLDSKAQSSLCGQVLGCFWLEEERCHQIQLLSSNWTLPKQPVF